MATPKTLIILVLFLGVISACPDGECRQLFFRAEFTFGNRRLIKHVIETIDVRDFDLCELHCYHQPNCVSINFVIPDRNGLHKCELNNATHRSHGWDLKNIDGYIYKGTESACDKGPCKNRGTCQSGYTDKGYRCLCPPQWTSDHCEQDVNECKSEQTNSCDRDANCNNTKGSYSCHCKQGFGGDGFNCTDVNECKSEQTNSCDRDAICNNTKGSYSCHCKQGFVGDGFNCAAIIPHPSAWFPLNGMYQTSEIENRTSSGSKGDRVLLSLGPDGTKDGSFFFRGSQGSSITFSDGNSKLDINVSITMLCWLYTYNNNAEMKFLQYKGMELFVNQNELKLTFPKPSSANSDYQLTGTLAERGWTFVGVSYCGTTAEAKLYVNGNMVSSKEPTANFIGSQLLKLGGNNFKGKITQLMLFNFTLTQEQITGLKGRVKLPAMIFDSTIISNNPFYSAELASFLAPVVGQMESKWNMCHSAVAHANGWVPKTFHDNCDKKNHTVTIIKTGPYIFGGYSDIPWESPLGERRGETLKAFIFSLSTNKALPPFKCLAKDKGGAIYMHSDYGPSFGQNPSLFIANPAEKSRARIDNPYKLPKEVNNEDPKNVLADTKWNFSPENYEVFYLA